MCIRDRNSTQQNSAMDMLRKKNTRTLSELEQIPYQPQVYAKMCIRDRVNTYCRYNFLL